MHRLWHVLHRHKRQQLYRGQPGRTGGHSSLFKTVTAMVQAPLPGQNRRRNGGLDDHGEQSLYFSEKQCLQYLSGKTTTMPDLPVLAGNSTVSRKLEPGKKAL